MTAVNWDTCSAETLMGVFMTNQATPSLHGGVVSDPLLMIILGLTWAESLGINKHIVYHFLLIDVGRKLLD
jgi:hypothetical protein